MRLNDVDHDVNDVNDVNDVHDVNDVDDHYLSHPIKML